MYGLPAIEGVNRLCDGCLIYKQKHTPFPSHGDLYGPIKPATPGSKTLFLLLVDDMSRFMWQILLQAKSETAEAIKRI